MMDTKKLRELAEAATPGPWAELKRCDNANDLEACGVTTEHRDKHGHIVGVFQSDAYDECSHPVSKANAAFIAAANPQTVIALLDRLDACKRGAADMVARVQEESFKHRTDGDLARAALDVMNREYESLRQQLAAMTAARDEACDIAIRLVEQLEPVPDGDWGGARDTIAQIRKVGSHD